MAYNSQNPGYIWRDGTLHNEPENASQHPAAFIPPSSAGNPPANDFYTGGPAPLYTPAGTDPALVDTSTGHVMAGVDAATASQQAAQQRQFQYFADEAQRQRNAELAWEATASPEQLAAHRRAVQDYEADQQRALANFGPAADAYLANLRQYQGQFPASRVPAYQPPAGPPPTTGGSPAPGGQTPAGPPRYGGGAPQLPPSTTRGEAGAPSGAAPDSRVPRSGAPSSRTGVGAGADTGGRRVRYPDANPSGTPGTAGVSAADLGFGDFTDTDRFPDIPRTSPGGYTGPEGNAYRGYEPAHLQTDIHVEGTSDPWQMAANDRTLAYLRGDELNYDTSQQAGTQAERARVLGTTGDAMQAWLARHPGYTPQQAEAILGADRLEGLQQTDAERNAAFLTPEEESGYYDANGNFVSGIRGDFSRIRGYFSPEIQDYQRGIAETGNQAQRGAVQNAGTNLRSAYGDEATELRGAIDPNLLGVSGGYRQFANDALDYGDTAVRGAVDPEKLRYSQTARNATQAALAQGETGVRKAIDPNALRLSGEYQQNYRFNPQDEQDIVNQAGRTAGAETEATVDALERRAAAEGNANPLAMAAAINRARYTGQMNTADAVTAARIRAKALGLSTTQEKEATRLTAERGLTDVATGNEQVLAARRLGANQSEEAARLAAEHGTAQLTSGNEMALSGRRLDTGTNLERMRLAAEQDISGRQMEAARTAGAARMGAEGYLAGEDIANERGIAERNLGNERYISGTGMQMEQGIDAAQAQRANQVATNRQATEQNNQAQRYQRGTYSDTALTQRAGQIAQTGRQDLAEVRGDIRGQQAQAEQNSNAAMAQRIGAFNATTGAAETASANAQRMYGTPGKAERIVGTIIGGARSAAAAGAGGAAGRIVTRPRYMDVGERGPEAIIELRPKRLRYAGAA